MIEKIRRMPAPRGFRKASARAAFGPVAVKQSSVAGMTSPVLFAICGNVGLTQEREPLNTRTALRALRSRRRLAEAAKIPEPGDFLFCCVREWCSEREVYGGRCEWRDRPRTVREYSRTASVRGVCARMLAHRQPRGRGGRRAGRIAARLSCDCQLQRHECAHGF